MGQNDLRPVCCVQRRHRHSPTYTCSWSNSKSTHQGAMARLSCASSYNKSSSGGGAPIHCCRRNCSRSWAIEGAELGCVNAWLCVQFDKSIQPVFTSCPSGMVGWLSEESGNNTSHKNHFAAKQTKWVHFGNAPVGHQSGGAKGPAFNKLIGAELVPRVVKWTFSAGA